MRAAFHSLKSMSPNLKHVTCIAHAQHHVAEDILDVDPTVNTFVYEMKRMLCINRIEGVEKKALILIYNAYGRHVSTTNLLRRSELQTLEFRRKLNRRKCCVVLSIIEQRWNLMTACNITRHAQHAANTTWQLWCHSVEQKRHPNGTGFHVTWSAWQIISLSYLLICIFYKHIVCSLF